MRTQFVRHSWPSLLYLALTVVVAGFSQNAPTALNSAQLIQFLNQTIDWYRRASAVQQTATDPDDVTPVSDNPRIANQIVRLAFDFTKTAAEGMGQGNSVAQRAQVQGQGSGPLRWFNCKAGWINKFRTMRQRWILFARRWKQLRVLAAANCNPNWPKQDQNLTWPKLVRNRLAVWLSS